MSNNKKINLFHFLDKRRKKLIDDTDEMSGLLMEYLRNYLKEKINKTEDKFNFIKNNEDKSHQEKFSIKCEDLVEEIRIISDSVSRVTGSITRRLKKQKINKDNKRIKNEKIRHIVEDMFRKNEKVPQKISKEKADRDSHHSHKNINNVSRPTKNLLGVKHKNENLLNEKNRNNSVVKKEKKIDDPIKEQSPEKMNYNVPQNFPYEINKEFISKCKLRNKNFNFINGKFSEHKLEISRELSLNVSSENHILIRTSDFGIKLINSLINNFEHCMYTINFDNSVIIGGSTKKVFEILHQIERTIKDDIVSLRIQAFNFVEDIYAEFDKYHQGHTKIKISDEVLDKMNKFMKFRNLNNNILE